MNNKQVLVNNLCQLVWSDQYTITVGTKNLIHGRTPIINEHGLVADIHTKAVFSATNHATSECVHHLPTRKNVLPDNFNSFMRLWGDIVLGYPIKTIAMFIEGTASIGVHVNNTVDEKSYCVALLVINIRDVNFGSIIGELVHEAKTIDKFWYKTEIN